MKTMASDKRKSNNEKNAYMLFNEVACMLRHRFRKERDSMGMKDGYRHIVYHLSHGDDGATQQTIVAHTHLSAPTVSVSLGRMERENIVRRVTDKYDQRSVHVHLTDKGWEMVSAMEKTYNDVERGFRDALTEEEFEQLGVILRKIRDNLSA
ncbi:MAG: winged helix-turn-helix transcriptional regulator [Ruminococcaceae bacterium]|nr:winged helix-turn-helix transcriptional regulator [Oscillospiraceae bacterium]MBQ8899201.1 winged helix-turn-helix transcriptional regulator [Clostridia bacterium]